MSRAGDPAPANATAPDKPGKGPTAGHKPDKPDRPPAPANATAADKPDRPDKIDKPDHPDNIRAGTDVKPAPSGPPKDKREAQTLLASARSEEASGHYLQAKQLYERVAKGSPKLGGRADALTGLARIAFQQKEPDQVIGLAQAALKAGAGDDARMLLGHAHYKKGDYAAAILQYRAILDRNPRNKEAQRSLREAEKQRKRGG